MKTIAFTLGVARSSVHERLRRDTPTRPITYAKSSDEALLQRVKKICDSKPSYGYRRTCALLNRDLSIEGKARVNHKRI